MLDGASRLKCLISIVLPLARPGLIAAGLLVFLEAWSEFFYALVLTNELTVPPVVAGLQNLQQFSWTTLAAASIFSLIPPVLIAVVFQRYIVSGLARGSVR
jgi:ABC-type glycerol-3-phosphate transport system permease component